MLPKTEVNEKRPSKQGTLLTVTNPRKTNGENDFQGSYFSDYLTNIVDKL